MRKYVIAAVVCLAVLSGIGQAQMRGGFGRGFSGGFRSGVSFGGPGRGIGRGSFGVVRPAFAGHHRFFGNNFGTAVCTPFGTCFRPTFFGQPGARFFGRHGSTFFGAGFGFSPWGGYPLYGGSGYGYGMPYYLDDSNYDDQVQADAADRQRIVSEMDYDRRRDMELQRQLAELQAAQEASSRTAQQQGASQPARSQSEAQPAPAVLVFRDGRQMQVDNYVITPDRLFTLGPDQRRTIQLSELDLNATVKANQDRGVTFAVPKSQAGK